MQLFAELWYADHTCIFQNNSSFFYLASFLGPDPVLDPDPECSEEIGSGSRTNHSRSTNAILNLRVMNYRICRNHIWIVDSAGVLKNAGTGKVTSYEEQANNVHTLYSAIDQDSGSGVTPFWTEVQQTDTYRAYRAAIIPNSVWRNSVKGVESEFFKNKHEHTGIRKTFTQ